MFTVFAIFAVTICIILYTLGCIAGERKAKSTVELLHDALYDQRTEIIYLEDRIYHWRQETASARDERDTLAGSAAHAHRILSVIAEVAKLGDDPEMLRCLIDAEGNCEDIEGECVSCVAVDEHADADEVLNDGTPMKFRPFIDTFEVGEEVEVFDKPLPGQTFERFDNVWVEEMDAYVGKRGTVVSQDMTGVEVAFGDEHDHCPWAFPAQLVA